MHCVVTRKQEKQASDRMSEAAAEAYILVESNFKSWLENIDPEKLKVLADMYDNHSCTDVVIQCQDNILIHAHREVLAARSRVFNVALKKTSRKWAVLQLRQLSSSLVKALLDLMYHNQVLVRREDARSLVYLMHVLELKGVFGGAGGDGILLLLSGAKLLGEHFDCMLQYTSVATYQGKPPASRCESRRSRPALQEPPRTADKVNQQKLRGQQLDVKHAPPSPLPLTVVCGDDNGAGDESSKIAEAAAGKEVQEHVAGSRPGKPRTRKNSKRRSRLLFPTHTALDTFLDVAAPGDYPRSPELQAHRTSNKPQVSGTSTVKERRRSAPASTKVCLDALTHLDFSRYTNVDTDGNKIPRPPNAFMIFGQDFRKLLAGERPGESNKAISVALGREWAALSDCERQAYYELQGLYKQQHQVCYPGYVYSPAQARQQKALRHAARR